jgi:hypothetical protein
MAQRDEAFLATGALISSYWVVWVTLHSWSQRRSEDRTIRPTLITLGVLGLVALAIFLIPFPRQWTGIAIFAAPLVASYFLRRGELDPGRRRVMRVALVLALLGVVAGLFVLQSADLLI